MKKTFCMVVALMLLTGFSGGTAFAKKKLLSISSASMGGTYYIIGSGLADILTRYGDNMKVNGVIAQGSVGNPILVDSGETEMGISNYYSSYNAVQGNKPYKKKLNIAAIMPLQSGGLHMVTLAKSDIGNIKKYRGAKISVGPAGGGGFLILKNALRVAEGIELDDFKPSYLSYSDGVQALIDGNVDVTTPHGAPPLQAIVQLATRHNIKFIQPTDAQFKKFTDKYPFYIKKLIPAGTYKGQDKDVYTFGTRDVLIVNKSLDDGLVYEITKTLYDNMDELRKIHPAAARFTMEGFKNSLIPLHPGAKKFYLEKGIRLE